MIYFGLSLSPHLIMRRHICQLSAHSLSYKLYLLGSCFCMTQVVLSDGQVLAIFCDTNYRRHRPELNTTYLTRMRWTFLDKLTKIYCPSRFPFRIGMRCLGSCRLIRIREKNEIELCSHQTYSCENQNFRAK